MREDRDIMANGNGLTAAEMITAIEKAQGFVSKAAELCGVSRQTFYKYLKKYATVKQALEDIREKRHDFVELKLMKAIEQGNMTAIIFYLKTQCKHRGYVERIQQEIGGKDGGPVQITRVEVIKDYGE